MERKTTDVLGTGDRSAGMAGIEQRLDGITQGL